MPGFEPGHLGGMSEQLTYIFKRWGLWQAFENVRTYLWLEISQWDQFLAKTRLYQVQLPIFSSFLFFFVVMIISSRSIFKHKLLLQNIFHSDLSSFSQMDAPGHSGSAAKKLLVTRLESDIPEPAVQMLKKQFRHFYFSLVIPKALLWWPKAVKSTVALPQKALIWNGYF